MMKYCPECGVNYIACIEGICTSTKHHGVRHYLRDWEHERVELVSSSFVDGGYYSGNTGKVIDVQACLKTGEIDLRVVWDSGADECWIPAEDCSGY